MAKRKTFVAREELMNQLSQIAKKKGFSLYETVNEIFEVAIASFDKGSNLRKILEEHSTIEAAKNAGLILGFESLWYEMTKIAYNKAKTKAAKSWYDAGVWLAKRYFKNRSDESFAAFNKDIKAFSWNIPEFTIDNTGTDVSVRILSPRFTKSYTLLLVRFWDGVFETFGYEVVKRDTSKGTVRLHAVRKKKHGEK